MLLQECNKLGLLSDSNTAVLTSKRYGLPSHTVMQDIRDWGFLLVNMITDEVLFTTFTQYTVSPNPSTSTPVSVSPLLPSLSADTFDSGLRTGSSPQG